MRTVRRATLRVTIVLFGVAGAMTACSALLDLHAVRYDDDGGNGVGDESSDTMADGDGALLEAAACPDGALGCQDFEGVVAPPWQLDDNEGGAPLHIVRAAAYTGALGLDVTVPPTDAGSGIVSFLLPQAVSTGDRIFVQARFRVATPLANASLIDLRHDRRSVSGGVSLKVINGKFAYNVTDSSMQNHASRTADTGPVLGAWECLGLEVDVGPSGKIHFLRNDEEVLSDDDTDTLAGEPAWQALWLGLPFVNSDAGVEVSVDDIIVTTDPISCTGP